MSDGCITFAESANGDRWALAIQPDAGNLHVLHYANPPSGGAVTRIEISDFLSPFVGSPEQQSLMDQIEAWVIKASKRDRLHSADIDTLRRANEGDVTRALDGTRIALPVNTAHDALELFNCMLDVMTDQREIDEAAARTRIAAGFGSTH